MPYYFKDILLSFSEAIQINRENAELYEKKIDYLEAALDRGLEKELGIDIKKDIEEAYIKAIKFNPTNYYYHLGLGWFYTEENRFKEAEKELMKSQSLYPIEFNVYLYLAKYYLKLGRKEGVVGVEEEIFKTLLRAINIIKYGRERNMWAQMKRMIKEVPTISWDERKGELKYIAELGADRFDFKQRKFPHDKIPLTIRLYIKDPVQEVALYKRDIRFQSFRKIKITPEYNVYEVKLDYFPNDTYLDDLRIETNPAIIINKIEIVKSFK
ncbi:MAG: hypothetical protein JSW17_01400 [Candidatus Omnitrophota bacterium]|nr:MAG: hypothetical protein JSW17_01400 [Candidatus Omnitrophota bacterium]